MHFVCNFTTHFCKTQHIVSYIRHFIQKWNILQSLGKHFFSKWKTLPEIGNTDTNSSYTNSTPIILSLRTINRPQISSLLLWERWGTSVACSFDNNVSDPNQLPPQSLCEYIDIVVRCFELDHIQSTMYAFSVTEIPWLWCSCTTYLIYIEEAGLNLAKTRWRGENVIGQRAIVNVPGQCGGNITLCAAIGLQGLLYHHATLDKAHMITFPNTLHNAVAQDGAEQPRFVVIWDNVSFPACSGPGLVHKPQYL